MTLCKFCIAGAVIVKGEDKTLKEMRNSYLCVTAKNNRLMFVPWCKYEKALSEKKVIVCFNNLGKENLASSRKVAAFVMLSACIMVLFEIHQRFKGNFLYKLRATFKGKLWHHGLYKMLSYTISSLIWSKWIEI